MQTHNTTRPKERGMPRWLAAAAVAATLLAATAASPQAEPGSASAEPEVTHASIIDSIFRVFQEYLGWRGYYDDPPRNPEDGW